MISFQKRRVGVSFRQSARRPIRVPGLETCAALKWVFGDDKVQLAVQFLPMRG